MRKADRPRIEQALREVSQAMHGMHTSLFGFRSMYNEIITAVTAEARASGAKEEDVYDLFRLSRCLSVDELDSLLAQVCRKIADLQTATRQEHVPEEVRKAREIIQHRFS